MKYRKLGWSDLNVSEISLGSWLTYGVGVERDRAAACVDKAFELGINFIDTANIYGRGAAESFLGEVLQGRPRDSYVLATKLFFPMTESDRGLSRAQVEKQLDASLKRLRTDYVDLYQCHRYDWDTPLEETMEALTRAVRSGKARHIGFSEWPADRIRAMLSSARCHGSRLTRLPMIQACATSGSACRAAGTRTPSGVSNHTVTQRTVSNPSFSYRATAAALPSMTSSHISRQPLALAASSAATSARSPWPRRR